MSGSGAATGTIEVSIRPSRAGGRIRATERRRVFGPSGAVVGSGQWNYVGARFVEGGLRSCEAGAWVFVASVTRGKFGSVVQQMSRLAMMVQYAARYSDERGQETTTVHNDGSVLSMSVRGVTFHGPDFDSLGPAANSDPGRVTSFPLLHDGCLCSCVIEVDIPLPVNTPDGLQEGLLTARPGPERRP